MAKYFQVWPSFWRGDRRAWPDDQKLLALYLLTCEHRSLEGYYYLPKGYIIADLRGWDIDQVDRNLAALETAGFCAYDPDAEVVFVIKALEHDAPRGDRRVKGAVTAVRSVPESVLWPQFVQACAAHAPELFHQLGEGTPPPPDTPSKPHADGIRDSLDTPSLGHPYAGARSSSSSSSSKPAAAAARTHTREDEKIHRQLVALAQRSSTRGTVVQVPSLDDVAQAIDDHPEHDPDRAYDSLAAWCRRSGGPTSLIGGFCKELRNGPKRSTPRPEHLDLAEPMAEDVAAWEETVTRLAATVPEATMDVYIRPLRLVGVADGAYVLDGGQVAGWTARKYAGVVAEAAGRPVKIINNEEAAA
jgi:hypothetical protein